MEAWRCGGVEVWRYGGGRTVKGGVRSMAEGKSVGIGRYFSQVSHTGFLRPPTAGFKLSREGELNVNCDTSDLNLSVLNTL